MWTGDVAAVVLAYLLGSVPFSHLIARWRAGLDIRQVGEGNVGARNVWHVVGPAWGVLAAVLDIGKGLGAVVLGRLLGASEVGALLVGPAVILGHAFPLFLRFRGGKGVATLVGVLLAWAPWSTLAGLAVFGVAQFFLRDFNRSVVFGFLAAILLPPAFGYPWTLGLYALVLSCLLAVKKWLDLAHERQVWARAGWKGEARPGWYRQEGLPREVAGEVHEGEAVEGDPEDAPVAGPM